MLGFLLAVLIDQRVRGEDLLRSVFLYPFSMSFIVTGLAWRWLLDPTFGIEKIAHDLGFEGVSVRLARAAGPGDLHPGRRSSLARLRAGHGDHARRPARHRSGDLEGDAHRRHSGLADLRLHRRADAAGSFATAIVLLATTVVRLYDLSVAMTNGGPGIASEVPAKFVMDYLFERANIGLATAAATSMLITVVAIVAPLLYWQIPAPATRSRHERDRDRRHAAGGQRG